MGVGIGEEGTSAAGSVLRRFAGRDEEETGVREGWRCAEG